MTTLASRGLQSGLRFNWGRPVIDRAEAEPFDRAAVARWWRSFPDDPWFKVEPCILVHADFIEHTTMNRRMITIIKSGYQQHGAPIPHWWLPVMAKVMGMVEGGHVAFILVTKPNAYRVAYLTAPHSLPGPQAPLLPRPDFNWWARCRSCGARRFTAVRIGENPHAACWNCVPPYSYGAIGAFASVHRLVADWEAKG